MPDAAAGMTPGDAAGYAIFAGGLALSAAAIFLGRARAMLAGAGLAAILFAAALFLPRALAQSAGDHPAFFAAAANFLTACAVFALAFAIDAGIRRFVWFGLLGENGRSRIPNIAIGMASAGGYALTAAFVASTLFGLDLTAVAAASGVLAIVLGMSAQQTLGQFFAGIALNASRPFRLGDSLQIDEVWGVVADADWRAVTLRTYEGTRVVLPNIMVAGARATNLGTAADAIRHHIPFVAEIDAPPARVRAAVLEALRGLPHALENPAPMVLFKNFDERGALYEAIFWHRDPNFYILRRDEAGQALWYALERAGIRMAVNRRFLESASGEAAVRAGEVGDIAARAAAHLAASSLFAGVPRGELEALAARARFVRYAPGERLMREGAPGASMFLILDGEASVRAQPDGAEVELYTLGPGEAVGHMSALTGAPRFATVRAIGHLELVEFGKESLAPLLRNHPEAADAAAREIVRIEEKVAAFRARTANAAISPDSAPLLGRLAERIRSFFGDQGGSRA